MPRSSPVCCDANLVVRRLLEPTNYQLQRRWREWLTEQQHLVAPTLIRYELTNAFHRSRQAGLITDATAAAALAFALDLPIHLHSEADLHQQALDFAARFNLPAAYDAHYLALADRIGAELWTADKRLFRAVQSELAWVRLAA